ncbi:MAG: hypothetical protein CMQ88_00525 [Gammaproteobacteria bacterium]|nr:hypothetical protein [Gammaproteobacteria bacterium]|tara:strand:+ start:328 stop:927 length:600 start_codon:yes stop_codon:yes gene_type:complete
MDLYCTLNSPFARKIRVLILELEMSHQVNIIETDPRDMSGPVVSLNPLAKVPVLNAGEAGWIIDSPVISEYLATKSTTKLSTNPADLRDRCMVALADGIVDAGYAARVEKLRPDNLQWQEWINVQFDKINRSLDMLQVNPELLPEPKSLGGIALACGIEWIQFRHTEGLWLENRPQLSEWLVDFSSRPSMISTKPVLPA